MTSLRLCFAALLLLIATPAHGQDVAQRESDDVMMTSATEATLIARFRDKPFDFPPGQGWHYSNSGYALLAFIIQKATGMTYEAAVRRYIFEPLGMTHSGFDFAGLSDPNKAVGYSRLDSGARVRSYVADSSVTIGAGSIHSTVGDVYRWHRGLQGDRLVSRPLLERAYTPKAVNYGYGVMIDSMFGRRVISHPGGIGGFTTYLARISEDDVCIALLDNTEHVSLQTIARKIVAILFHQPYGLAVSLGARTTVAVSDSILGRYVGRYKDPYSSRVATVGFENGGLVVRFTGGPPFTLGPTSQHRFFVSPDMASFEIEFTPNESGEVSRLVFDDVGVIQTFDREQH